MLGLGKDFLACLWHQAATYCNLIVKIGSNPPSNFSHTLLRLFSSHDAKTVWVYTPSASPFRVGPALSHNAGQGRRITLISRQLVKELQNRPDIIGTMEPSPTSAISTKFTTITVNRSQTEMLNPRLCSIFLPCLAITVHHLVPNPPSVHISPCFHVMGLRGSEVHAVNSVLGSDDCGHVI
jgi:hypothetical protein